MFGFKKEMRECLTKLAGNLDRLTNLVHSDQRLAEQNERLMDRLMSKDWENYALYSPDVLNKLKSREEEREESPLTDEGNIGEILTDEELSQ